MSGNEDQIVFLYAGARPVEVIIKVSWLVIFVNSKECHVEVVTGIGEVVRIAAEKGRLELGREDQAHVRVFLVFVQVVHFARVEGHDVAAQPGGGGTVFFDG